ncbi:MAG: hypothetical protein WCK05_06695 [Planctomycetota bacterium]
MPVPVIVTAAIGLFLLGGCGGPIPRVRANSEPEGQFVRVKSAERVQGEQAHAEKVRREHDEASASVSSAEASSGAPASTRPTTPPASEPTGVPASPVSIADEPATAPASQPAPASESR